MSPFSPSWILRNTVATVLALLIGLAVAVLVGLFVAAEAPGGTRDLRAYQAAPRCPAAPAAPAECRWTQEFTASGIELTSSRSKSDRVLLTGADGVKRETFYSNHAVLTDLEEGDRVTGTVWRGLVTEIAAKGDSQKTQDAPADMRARLLIMALITIPAALLMTAACGWRLCRHRAAPTPGMIATLGLAPGLFGGGLVSALFSGPAESFWRTLIAWLVITAVLAAVARFYVTQKRTPATAPATPGG
ncbi:hypothetical protein [Actinomadura xylanilytica]|uniref:hypothetical protein n=1 Tax=Actinomadura xylanilytica TaxID=887459 RepID=UPI00255AD6DA|nr:hypothetical protein [Actinomadura xylanilytica]MDL4771934.1 hypothetical protein [Actinomadura xylanilytica]